MDIRKVKKLIDLLSESGMSEIEIKEGEESVRISRYGNGMAPQIQTFAPMPPVVPSISATDVLPSTIKEVTKPIDANIITSPMVGTFYSKPSPDAKPFIVVGQTITNGDTICIIEAMKIMNKIEAEISGTIIEINVEDGEAVEFGQTLLIVK